MGGSPRKWLAAFRRLDLRKDANEGPEQRDGTEKDRKPSAPILHAELQVPQAAIDAYRAEQQKAQKLDPWRFAVEVIALAAAIFYAGISYKAWQSMLAANNLSREALIIAHRAWVLVDQIPVRPAGQDSGPGSFLSDDLGNVALSFKNFGDGPASEVHVMSRLACLPVGAHCPDPAAITPGVASTAVLGPNHVMSADSVFVWSNHCCATDVQLAKRGTVRLQCEHGQVVPGNPAMLTTHRLFVSTRITYRDQFGRQHWANNCAVWNSMLQVFDVAENGNAFE